MRNGEVESQPSSRLISATLPGVWGNNRKSGSRSKLHFRPAFKCLIEEASILNWPVSEDPLPQLLALCALWNESGHDGQTQPVPAWQRICCALRSAEKRRADSLMVTSRISQATFKKSTGRCHGDHWPLVLDEQMDRGLRICCFHGTDEPHLPHERTNHWSQNDLLKTHLNGDVVLQVLRANGVVVYRMNDDAVYTKRD